MREAHAQPLIIPIKLLVTHMSYSLTSKVETVHPKMEDLRVPSVQRMMLKVFSKLPNGLLVRMAGGTPIQIRGRTLDPMMQLLWAEGKKQPSISNLTPQQARLVMDDAARLLGGGVPKVISAHGRAISGPSGEIPVRVYRPRSSSPLPIVLFFHQGGFVIGGLDTCDTFCTLMAHEAECVVVNVDYRMAPEFPFPAPVEDALAAYQWVLDHAAELGGDPRNVGVCGDSAGGMLSALICQEAKRNGWQAPSCQILIYPWLVPYSGLPSYSDFADAYPLTAEVMEWFSSLYFTDDAEKSHRLASPGECPDLAGLPPALIVGAGFDPLSDEAQAYAERLQDAGVPVIYRCMEHLPHSFCMMGLVPAAYAAQREIIAEASKLIHR